MAESTDEAKVCQTLVESHKDKEIKPQQLHKRCN